MNPFWEPVERERGRLYYKLKEAYIRKRFFLKPKRTYVPFGGNKESVEWINILMVSA